MGASQGLGAAGAGADCTLLAGLSGRLLLACGRLRFSAARRRAVRVRVALEPAERAFALLAAVELPLAADRFPGSVRRAVEDALGVTGSLTTAAGFSDSPVGEALVALVRPAGDCIPSAGAAAGSPGLTGGTGNPNVDSVGACGVSVCTVDDSASGTETAFGTVAGGTDSVETVVAWGWPGAWAAGADSPAGAAGAGDSVIVGVPAVGNSGIAGAVDDSATPEPAAGATGVAGSESAAAGGDTAESSGFVSLTVVPESSVGLAALLPVAGVGWLKLAAGDDACCGCGSVGHNQKATATTAAARPTPRLTRDSLADLK